MIFSCGPSFLAFNFLLNCYYSKPLLKCLFSFSERWLICENPRRYEFWFSMPVLLQKMPIFTVWCIVSNSSIFFFRIQIDELIRSCQLFEYCLHETWGLASFAPLTTRLFKQIYISITLFTNFTDEQLFNTTSNDSSRWN